MTTHSCRFPPHFVDLLLDAVFLVDAVGQIVHVSAACTRLLGYTQEEMIGRPLFDFIAPQDHARTLAEVCQVTAGQARVGFENRYHHKDGHLVDIMWSASWSESDQLRMGVARDVSERKQLDRIQAVTHAISGAVHTTHDLMAFFSEVRHLIINLVPLEGFVVLIRDPGTGRLDCAYPMVGEAAGSVLQQQAFKRGLELIRNNQPLYLKEKALLEQPENSSTAEQGWLVLPLLSQQAVCGALILKRHLNIRFSEKEEELLQLVGEQVAIAIERKQLMAELRRMAQYDELTGLPNRRLFHERVNAALARCRRQHSRLALLFMDIDKFKQINDTHGHAVGDLLLQEIATRMDSDLRQEDTVFRLGGDEFVVLLEDLQRGADAFLIADKIKELVCQPVYLSGVVLRVRASLGVALYPEDGLELKSLLKHADQLMYVDKNTCN